MHPVHGPAVLGVDHHVLRDVHQTPRQVARVRGAQGGVRQALSRAVSGHEVLEQVQTVVQVVLDRQVLDQPAERITHQPAHPGDLRDVSHGRPRAGVDHHPQRVEGGDAPHDLIGDLLSGLLPAGQHAAFALVLGDDALGRVLVRPLDFLFGASDDRVLIRRDMRVIQTDAQTRARHELEAQRLDLVHKLGRPLLAVAVVAVHHDVRQLRLRHVVVVERHVGRQVVVEDDPPHGGGRHRSLDVHGELDALRATSQQASARARLCQHPLQFGLQFLPVEMLGRLIGVRLGRLDRLVFDLVCQFLGYREFDFALVQRVLVYQVLDQYALDLDDQARVKLDILLAIPARRFHLKHRQAHVDQRVQVNQASLVRAHDRLGALECLARGGLVGEFALLGHVVAPENDVVHRLGDREPVGGLEQVLRRQHQQSRLGLRVR